MKIQIKYIILSILLLCSIAAAKTVNLRDYATPNDGLTDTAGFQQAVNVVLQAGGGTLLVSEGIWDIDATVQLGGTYSSLILQGDGGSIIRIATNPGFFAFQSGNANSLDVRDLSFIPANTNGTVIDTGAVIVSSHTEITRIINCRFIGLRASYGIMMTSNTDLIIESTQFDGTAAGQGSVWGVGNGGFRSITLRNALFRDYANFNGTYYSKSQYAAAWVRVDSDANQVINANWGGTLVIDGGRFDEAALSTVEAYNVRNVQIKNIAVNLNGSSGGKGIVLNNVKYGVIESSVFGYNPRQAVILQNNSTAEVSKLAFGNGATLGTTDFSSQFRIGHCPDC